VLQGIAFFPRVLPWQLIIQLSEYTQDALNIHEMVRSAVPVNIDYYPHLQGAPAGCSTPRATISLCP
ncbi:MAG: hypothetical protein WBO34_04280, partial [Gammaproteobacteria bacterium]